MYWSLNDQLLLHILFSSRIETDTNNKTTTKAIYINPSVDGKTPGKMLLDSQSWKNLPKYEIPVLMLHEGLPGHHMQVKEYHGQVKEYIRLVN